MLLTCWTSHLLAWADLLAKLWRVTWASTGPIFNVRNPFANDSQHAHQPFDISITKATSDSLAVLAQLLVYIIPSIFVDFAITVSNMDAIQTAMATKP